MRSLIIGFSLLMAGCNMAVEQTPGSDAAAEKQSKISMSALADKRWELVGVDGLKPVAQAWLKFDPATGKFSGNGGCNRMFGTVSEESGQLRIAGVASTKMLCSKPVGVSEQESNLFACLNNLTDSSLEDGTLTLSGDGRTLQFVNSEGEVSDK